MSSNPPRMEQALDLLKSTKHRIGTAFRHQPIQHPPSNLAVQASIVSTSTYHSSPAQATDAQCPTQPTRSLVLGEVVGDVASESWAGLLSALNTLEQCANLCPPIKPAISALLVCVLSIDRSTQGRKEYNQLASKLRAITIDLAKQLRESQSPQVRLCVTNLINGIERELARVSARILQRGPSRVHKAEADLEDIDACYRRIDTLYQQLQSNAVLSMWSIAERQEMNQCLERMRPAMYAQYNAGISTEFHRRACTQGTRQGVLTQLHDWSNDPYDAKLYWINGMAGTGKTTIAYTLCSELERSSKLGASFFCSRELPECRDVLNIVPTIAYRLARFSPTYRFVLCRTLLDDPDVSRYDVTTQFHRLIAQPLLEVKTTIPNGLIVVVIDALDECSDPFTAHLLLNALTNFTLNLPIKFLVTCRPEHGFLDKILLLDSTSLSLFHLHDIEKATVQKDIEIFIRTELKPASVSEDHIRRLAERAGNLFIYAATVVRYMLPGSRSIDPQKRLVTMLDTTSRVNASVDRRIDALYEKILSVVLEDDNLEPKDTEAIRLVLHTVICAKEPLNLEVIAGLLYLESPEDARRALEPLRSVMYVPEDGRPASVLHTSLSDYLLDPTRSGPNWFFCNHSEHSCIMALTCLKVMKTSLRFNICGLESSFELDDEVLNIQTRIDRNISLHLYYACKYWGNHLCEAGAADGLMLPLEEFLSSQLLFWIEVLNLKDCLKLAVDQLPAVDRWLQKYYPKSGVHKLVQDAYKFAARTGASPVSRSTPHMYVSILAVWDKGSALWEHYGPRIQGLARPEGKALEKRGETTLAVWSVNEIVGGISVSSDGRRIAAGVGEDVMVLDAQSGILLMGPFKGHTGFVGSVAFSPDDSLIASGSVDRTIRIWEVRSGDASGTPLIGHIDVVQSATFSPDGDRIVSSSRDGAIFVWDVKSRDVLTGPLIACAGLIGSVVLSPDGCHIISGDWKDPVIQMWDAYDTELAPVLLEGHSDGIRSIIFSPDGGRIVSASYDHTIIVWEAKDGVIGVGPLRGHNSGITSIAFSLDGNLIVSGSWGGDICVWDSQSGELLAGPFQDHTDSITSVTFAPSGDYIVSGSPDGTIRVWDTTTKGIVSYTSDKRYNGVKCMAFLPNDSQIVAGCGDGAIRVWDADTKNEAVCLRKVHKSAITCLTLSTDGGYFASGSDDGTVYVWDVVSRDMVTGPLTQEDSGGGLYRPRLLAFAPHSDRIACISDTGSAYIWDVKSRNTLVGPIQLNASRIHSITYLLDNDACVAFGSDQNTIYIWNTSTGDMQIITRQGYQAYGLPNYIPELDQGDTALALSFSPDGHRVASSSLTDCAIYIWDAASGDILIGPLQGNSNPVRSLVFSHDGNLVASASEFDHTICVWDSWEGRMLFGPFEGHTGPIDSLTFLSDIRVASGSWDGTVRVWDIGGSTAISGITRNDGWTMDDSGWIMGIDSQRMLWVPFDLRPYLIRPHNSLLVSNKGSFSLDFKGAFVGDEWEKCYVC